jgi:predicted nuclease with TOPRIM domain
MQTISVKIDDDVYQELEKYRGNEIKSVYYRKLIDTYLKLCVYQDLQQVYNELKTAYDNMLAVQEAQKSELEKYHEHQRVYAELKEKYDKLSIEYSQLSAAHEVQKERIEDLQKANGFYIQEVESWKRQAEKALYPSQEEQKEKPWWKFW